MVGYCVDVGRQQEERKAERIGGRINNNNNNHNHNSKNNIEFDDTKFIHCYITVFSLMVLTY